MVFWINGLVRELYSIGAKICSSSLGADIDIIISDYRIRPLSAVQARICSPDRELGFPDKFLQTNDVKNISIRMLRFVWHLVLLARPPYMKCISANSASVDRYRK